MSKLNEHDVQFLIDKLQKGEPIPYDYKTKLFPTKQKEYELVYAGKMRTKISLPMRMAFSLCLCRLKRSLMEANQIEFVGIPYNLFQRKT